MRRRGTRFVWVHAGLVTLAASSCAAVWLWSGARGDAERRMVIRQSTVLAEALTAAYAGQLSDRLGVAAPGHVRLTEDCMFCVISWRDPTGVADLAPLLRGMAQAGPGPSVIAAIASPDGGVRVMHADGRASSARLLVSDAGRVMAGAAVLDQEEFGGPPMAMASAPLGSGLALAIGIDLTNSLDKLAHRRRQDEAWAIGTMALLALAAAGASIGVERMVRRDRRLSDDRVALSLANDELKGARDQARAHGLELQTIFNSLSDGVSHFDGDMRLVQWNHRFPDLTGVPVELLRAGVRVEDVLRAQAAAGEFGPLPSAEALEAEIARRLDVLSTATPMHVVERARPNGRALELRRTSLPGGGFVTIYTDITSRKQVEAVREAARAQAERSAEEKARFVAIVSHEIRTPLNVTLNALGLIDREALPAAQRSLVDTGLQAGDALLALLNDILDLARLEAGQMSITPGAFALRPLVEGVGDMYRQVALERGIELQVAVSPRVPERITADAGRLRQMLMNLVSNSAKYSGPGVVRLEADIVGPHPTSLRLSVVDCGPAIADADRERLFRPFSQLDRAAEPSAGSGLGLAICSMLATRMGGSIGCRTEAAGGNEFWIVLPIDARPEAAAAGAAAPGSGGPRARILVVEDLAANQMVLATMLQRDGHAVDIAGSGHDALQAVANRRYDIVLMDLLMPGMDGLEATRRIRALGGAAGAVPIVGVTADTSEESRSACLAAGMACVLAKPIRPATLADAIRHRLARRIDPGDGSPDRREAEVLDIGRLGDLPGADALLLACLDELRGSFQALDQATRRGDVPAVIATAHAMSGAAGNHGFERLDRRLRALMTITAVDLAVADTVALVARDLDDAQEAAVSLQLAPVV